MKPGKPSSEAVLTFVRPRETYGLPDGSTEPDKVAFCHRASGRVTSQDYVIGDDGDSSSIVKVSVAGRFAVVQYDDFVDPSTNCGKYWPDDASCAYASRYDDTTLVRIDTATGQREVVSTSSLAPDEEDHDPGPTPTTLALGPTGAVVWIDPSGVYVWQGTFDAFASVRRIGAAARAVRVQGRTLTVTEPGGGAVRGRLSAAPAPPAGRGERCAPPILQAVLVSSRAWTIWGDKRLTICDRRAGKLIIRNVREDSVGEGYTSAHTAGEHLALRLAERSRTQLLLLTSGEPRRLLTAHAESYGAFAVGVCGDVGLERAGYDQMVLYPASRQPVRTIRLPPSAFAVDNRLGFHGRRLLLNGRGVATATGPCR